MRGSLGLAQQAFAIKNSFPDSRPLLARGRLIWRWEIRPGEITSSYNLLLLARDEREARVYVEEPDLRPNENGLLPHVYDNGSLCLNRHGEWQPRMLFVDTFIPWAAQWLIFYELWKATDIWYGDGPDFLDKASQSALLHPYSGPEGVDSW